MLSVIVEPTNQVFATSFLITIVYYNGLRWKTFPREHAFNPYTYLHLIMFI